MTTSPPSSHFMRLPLARRLLTLLLVLFAPTAALAQSTASILHPGDDVRVLAPSVRGSRVRGTVVLYQGSTLDIRERSGGEIVSIPVASIRDLARNVGVHRGRASWRMARFGAFLGGAGGLVAGPLIATSRAPDAFTGVMIASAVIGISAGAGIGAALGAALARDEWQHFRMPIVPTVSADAGALRLGAAFAP